MSRPLATGHLWQAVVNAPKKDLVVVVDASDMRSTEDVKVSRSLSWERTAKDFIYELLRVDACTDLQKCQNLVVQFGREGAILYHGASESGCLFYEKSMLEGDVKSYIPGWMMGERSLFTATLVSELAAGNDVGMALKTGIILGLTRIRMLLTAGFTINTASTVNAVQYPLEEVLSGAIKTDPPVNFKCCEIDMSHGVKSADPKGWRILNHLTSGNSRLVAADSVKDGVVPADLDAVPELIVEEFSTRDRYEIEHLRAIRELMDEYLANQRPEHPLCFAVFGPPGSGKSFAVKQLIKSLSTMGVVPKFYNISQMVRHSDLIQVFHEIRDVSLDGKVPFAFFDEFDCKLDQQELGWLASFLAPMQDGKFADGGVMHPIGKAIFCFAGGTTSSYTEFLNYDKMEYRTGTPFKTAKGKDFVSRLRGFFDVMGPDRQVTETDDDDVFVFRRANLFRNLLKQSPTASGLLRPDGSISIDGGVLRAFLYVRRFTHGARSISAIIEMSRLSGKTHYDKSCLPEKGQLDMHVDAEEFLWLCERERFQSLLRRCDLVGAPEGAFQDLENRIVGPLSKLIDQEYRDNRKKSLQAAPLHDLFGNLKQSNLDAAEHIPTKLLHFNYTLRKAEPTLRELQELIAQGHPLFAANSESPFVVHAKIPELGGGKPEVPLSNILKQILKPGASLSEDQSFTLSVQRARNLLDFKPESSVTEALRALGETMPVPKALEHLKTNHKVKGAPPFTVDQVIELSILEHDRFCRERRMAGYKYAAIEKADHTKLLSPFLVSFEKLPLPIAVYDVEAVEALPSSLAELGYVIVPMASGSGRCSCHLSGKVAVSMSKSGSRVNPFQRGSKNNRTAHATRISPLHPPVHRSGRRG
jgi:hypothetical protein